MTVNGKRLTEVVFAEQLAGGSLLIPVEAWTQARLAPLAQTTAMSDGTPAYALDAIAGATHTLDRQALSLLVSAPPSAFAGASINLRDGLAAPPPRPSPGAMLNYDVSLSHDAGTASGGAALEAVFFSAMGNLVSSALVTDTGTERYATRLDTYWRYDLPQRMEALVIGDTVGVGGGWSSPVRFGGIRWGRDFGLRPGFVTLPQISLTGAAALPSTVDVLVNNVVQSSQPVQPGPFDLTDVPIVTGAGQIGLVVRDLLGRETVIQQSYYAAPVLLAPGLSDFSFEAGWLRTGYGRDSDYGASFGAATWRQGISDSLSAEGRVELQANRCAGGVSIASLLGTWGVGYTALAASSGNIQGPSESGQLLKLGLERSTGRASATLRYERASRGFAPFGEAIGPLAAGQRSRESWLASLGGSLGGPISAAMSYVRQSRWNGDRVQWVGLSLSAPLGQHANLNASINKRLDGDKGLSAGVYVNVRLDDRMSASAQMDRDSRGELQGSLSAERNAPAGPGLGWRVQASSTAGQRASGALHYNSNYYELGLQAVVDRQVAARVGARGTVGWFEHMPFASRPLGESSVAVVKVDGIEGVPVYRSHQIAAVTNARGLAFVAGVLPWQKNQISIDPVDLPLDVEVASPIQEVTPYARSGVLVDFGARRSRQALLVLLQPDGTPIPVGAKVRLLPGGPEFAFGRRGEAWVSDLAERRQAIEVSWPAGGCTLTLNVPASPDGTPGKIGPLECAAAGKP